MKKNKFLIIFFVLFFNITFISILNAAYIIHRPVNIGVNGVPVRITASIDKAETFLMARLYVKRGNESIFFPIPMTGSGRLFYGEIPGRYIVNEGTRYYIEVTLQDRKKIVFPSGAPLNSNEIKNQNLNLKIRVTVFKPKMEEKLKDPKPELSAFVAGLEYLNKKETIKVMLDDRIINAKIDKGYIRYKSPIPLSPGKHTFTIKIYNEHDTVISEIIRVFYIFTGLTDSEKIGILERDRADGIGESTKIEEWKSSGSFNMTYQYARTNTKNDSKTPLPYPDGYYVLQGQFEASLEDTSIFLGPMLITSQKEQGGDRIEKFSFGFKKENFYIKAGTLSSALTPLTGVGINILGGEMSWDTITSEKEKGIKLKIFSGQSKKGLESEDDPNNMGVFAQQTHGAQISCVPLSNFGYISIQGFASNDKEESISNPGLIPVIKNQSASIYSKIFMPSFTTLKFLEFEYGANRNSIALPSEGGSDSGADESSGAGFYLKGTGLLKVLRTEYVFTVKRMNPDFYTPYSTYQSDILGSSFLLNHKFIGGKVSLSEGVDFSKDNLNDQKESTTYTSSGNMMVNLNFKNIPSLTISDNFQHQKNDDEESEIEMVNNAVTVSTGYSFKFLSADWMINLSFTQNDIKDMSTIRVNNDMKNRIYTPGISFVLPFADWINLTSGVSYSLTENIESDGENSDKVFLNNINDSLSINMNLFKNRFSLFLSFNHSTLFDKKTIHETYSHNYFYSTGIQVSTYKNHKIVISGSFKQYSDRVNSDQSYNNLSVTVGYNAIL